MTRLVSVPQQELSTLIRSQTERLTRMGQQTFLELVHVILATIDLKAWSPAQQIAFEQEDLRIRFAEPAG